MIVVTGGAGFIGSCIISALNEVGIKDIIVVDNINTSEKWKYLVNKTYLYYYHKTEFLNWLLHDKNALSIDIIIHMGACSSTTEKDFDYLYQNNFLYTKTLWEWCSQNSKRLIYASSAATYGDGTLGFSDSLENIPALRPLNGYGYSKQLFDLWALKQIQVPAQYVGLKFFNVYGPNEYHKGTMASVIFHAFHQINESRQVRLFKSYADDFRDGEQKRDFIYVKDITKTILFLLDHPNVNGIFNVGTGRARTFYDLAVATFNALNIEPNIVYIDMPDNLKEKYQYFTQAPMERLSNLGLSNNDFYSLEDGVRDYVQGYLMNRNAIL